MTNIILRKAGLAFDKRKTDLALKKATFALVVVIEFKTSRAKATRRKAAVELKSGLGHQASMDIEQVIRQEFEIQAYDTVRRQCNEIADRLSLIASEKQCPVDIKQAVSTIIWAAGKAEVPEELLVVKAQLSKRYGKEFTLRAQNNENGCVNKMVLDKLLFQNDPSASLVEDYVKAITDGLKVVDIKNVEDKPTQENASLTKENTKECSDKAPKTIIVIPPAARLVGRPNPLYKRPPSAIPRRQPLASKPVVVLASDPEALEPKPAMATP